MMYYEGALIGLATFLIIGAFHPVVIKTNSILVRVCGGYFCF